MRRHLAALALAATACTGGGTGPATPSGDIVVVVSAPVTRSPWVGKFVVNGATLAVEEINAAGGMAVTPDGGTRRKVRLEVLDHADSVQQAQANARRAVEMKAAMLVTDGVGALAVASVTDPARLPVFVTFEGGSDLIDEETRPTLFRMAPANRPMARRLADYVADRHRTARVAVISDDTDYGRAGRADLADAMKANETVIARTAEIPAGTADPAPQVLQVRRSGAEVVLLWARAPAVAAVLRSIRSSGWTVPVYTGPSGEDPLVRQQLADHPEWVDGLTFVSFRITAEVGPEPFQRFRTAYEKRFGPDRIGVRDVVMPPDWAMYPYDAVHLVAAAVQHARGRLGQPLLDALGVVSITGANGDERSFLPRNHEGVSQDDMYFAVFRDMRFFPVGDDVLSKNLPPVPQ